MKKFAVIFIVIILLFSFAFSGWINASTTVYRKTLGVIVESDPYTALPTLERRTGHHFRAFLWYQSITENFNSSLANWLWRKSTKMQLSWEPWDPSGDPVNQPRYRLRAIMRGYHDREIKRWAQQLKAFGREIFFRPMCEMNGNWTSWSGTVNGNRPSEYIYAWRHVFNVFKNERATNVKFVWSPNRDASYSAAENTFNTYYPGSSYVHYVGINGYNWGRLYSTPTWTSEWQSFDAIFGYSYRVFTRRTNKWLIISETGSTEIGGHKSSWTKDLMYRLRYSYGRIRAVYFFNLNKETDWRIESSTANLRTFRYYSTMHN